MFTPVPARGKFVGELIFFESEHKKSGGGGGGGLCENDRIQIKP